MLRRWLSLLLLLTVTWPLAATAEQLDGRTVILAVFDRTVSDPALTSLEGELLRLRSQLGLSQQEMPIIVLGFQDPLSDPATFQRLGFKAQDAPVLCVAEWGNPARFGPKRVVSEAIVRRARPQHSAAVMNAFLAQVGQQSRLEEPAGFGLKESLLQEPVADLTPGRLEIDNVRFEVGGQTLFLTNLGVRIRNLEQRTLRDVKIRFYVRPTGHAEWKLLEEQTVDKILAANLIVRDHLADSRKAGLVGDDGFALPSQYRIEVEHVGQVVSQEGDFTPLLPTRP
jgi:hypothetical protein